MEFNKTEQRAILKLLDYVIKADDVLEDDELNYLAEIALQHGFDDSILIDLHEFGLNKAINLVDEMDEEKTKYVLKMVKEQAKSDDDFAKSEKDFLNELKKKLN